MRVAFIDLRILFDITHLQVLLSLYFLPKLVHKRKDFSFLCYFDEYFGAKDLLNNFALLQIIEEDRGVPIFLNFVAWEAF